MTPCQDGLTSTKQRKPLNFLRSDSLCRPNEGTEPARNSSPRTLPRVPSIRSGRLDCLWWFAGDGADDCFDLGPVGDAGDVGCIARINGQIRADQNLFTQRRPFSYGHRQSGIAELRQKQFPLRQYRRSKFPYALPSGVPLTDGSPLFALNPQVISFLIAVGAILAIARDRNMDQAGTRRAHRLRAHTQMGCGTGGRVLHKHIRLADHRLQQGRLISPTQVKANRFLAAIRPDEIGAFAMYQPVIAARAGDTAGPVPSDRRGAACPRCRPDRCRMRADRARGTGGRVLCRPHPVCRRPA